MNHPSAATYSPAIRTRRAELLGISEVRSPFERGLLPLFELTRSRRSKKNPEGSVEFSVDEVVKLVDANLFVVDMTTLDSLSNPQVINLLDPSGYFSNWTSFVTDKLPETAIPMVHLTDPYDGNSVAAQIAKLKSRHSFLALRIPSEFGALDSLAATISGELGSMEDVVVYADVGMVTSRSRFGAEVRVREVAASFEALSPAFIAPLASSFPSTVAPYGDAHGGFPLHEVAISDSLKQEFDELNCIHGDYACIHPLDAQGMAINWVPRVDVPLEDSLYYYRYRRNEGSYARAAADAIRDKHYISLPCWAHDNLLAAAKGAPLGKSPAHWISVRLNYHIERQLQRLA